MSKKLSPSLETTEDLFLIGITHQKADATTRGKFTVFPHRFEELKEQAKALGITQFLVISTCNRTELYYQGSYAHNGVELLAHHTQNPSSLLREVAFVKTNQEAKTHFWRLSAGLESQILGDFEIASQIKLWAKLSQEAGCLGGYLSRMVQMAQQMGKQVRSQTELSSGSASVAYVAVQKAYDYAQSNALQHIVLYGLGKIGLNACSNLIRRFPNTKVTLINRTFAKAKTIAQTHGFEAASEEKLPAIVPTADVLIVATAAQQNTIAPNIIGEKPLLLLDLSIPSNVEAGVALLPNVLYCNVDDLSKVADTHLEQRKKEVPKAEKIIEHRALEFEAWEYKQKWVQVLKQAQHRLTEIKQEVLHQTANGNDEQSIDTFIQKIVRQMAKTIEAEKNPMEMAKIIEKLFEKHTP